MKYLKDAAGFLEKIKKTDEVVIIFNNDGDGICSCALIMKYLELSGKRKPYTINQPMPMDKNLMQRIKTTIPNKIIFLDLVVDQQEDLFKKVRGLADILIIDHHQIHKNLNNKNVVHFNPRFTSPSAYTSTAYNAYKICSELVDVEKWLWIAAVGMVSDYNLEDSKDLVKKVGEKYGVGHDLYKTFLGRFADMIFSTRATRELSCEQMTEVLLKIEDPKKPEAEGFDKMVKSSQVINEELEDILSDAKENVEIESNLVVYKIKSKYNLDSVISTKISEKYLDKLVLVVNKNNGRYKVSARNQKKNINAGKVLQNATKGLKASGGGHEAAAGATVDEKDWAVFMERVKEMANK